MFGVRHWYSKAQEHKRTLDMYIEAVEARELKYQEIVKENNDLKSKLAARPNVVGRVGTGSPCLHPYHGAEL